MKLLAKPTKCLQRYHVNLPESFFLNILEQGHDFQQVLCLKVSTPFHPEKNRSRFCSVYEFTAPATKIEMSFILMKELKISYDAVIEVQKVECPPAPVMIRIRAQNESFGEVDNIRERLESIIADQRILQAGDGFELNYRGNVEPFKVEEIVGENNTLLPVALVIGTEVKVDFLPTEEAMKINDRKSLEKNFRVHAAEHKENVFTTKNSGNKLGGKQLTRDERLANLELRARKSKCDVGKVE